MACKLDGSLRAAVGLVLAIGTLAIQALGQKQEKTPDFGPNVTVFNPAMPAAAIQEQIDKVYAVQQHSEFGPARNALLFCRATTR